VGRDWVVGGSLLCGEAFIGGDYAVGLWWWDLCGWRTDVNGDILGESIFS